MAKVTLKTGPEVYGDNLFIVKTVKSVCDQNEISVRAAGMVMEHGDLIFLDNDEQPTLSIARGGWNAVYLADPVKQTPVSVERWHNEIGRTVVVQKDYTDEELSNIILKYIDENDNIKEKIFDKLINVLEQETSPAEESEVVEEITPEEMAGMESQQ
jgi:hypothetical protein